MQIGVQSYLDVIALMVVTAFSEEAMVDNVMNVELIEQRITVLKASGCVYVYQKSFDLPWKRML